MQTMGDRDGVIWFDGEMVPWREAQVHVLTHTLHYGMGVFEGVRVGVNVAVGVPVAVGVNVAGTMSLGSMGAWSNLVIRCHNK